MVIIYSDQFHSEFGVTFDQYIFLNSKYLYIMTILIISFVSLVSLNVIY